MKLRTALLTLALSSLSFAQVAAPVATGPSARSATGTVREVPVLDLGLEHMSLTAAEIRQRDRLLKPIYDNYQTVNLSSVANAMERAYGINVYHHMLGGELTLKDKKAVMENAVRYYLGKKGLFDQADQQTIPMRAAVKRSWDPDIKLKLIQGNPEKFGTTIDESTPSILTTEVREFSNEFLFFGEVSKSQGVFTSSQDPLFSAPSMSDFLDAMKALNLRGLDATVTFMSGQLDGNAKYQVIYPHFSKIAPIPQPVIFLSRDANYDDVVDLLREHAPRIYAHNKLFNANLLPSVRDINEMLRKYPNILAEVQRVKGQVSRENLINAIQGAFLKVTYSSLLAAGAVLASPVGLLVVASSASLSPVFISTIIIGL